jgi:AcrR family transcriptional regulator
MPRRVKEEEYAARRNGILVEAQRLVYTKGYEQMTIQDILDGLQISKGAFYHYFGSKQALLEALIEQILDQAEQILIPVLQDANLPALEKLHRYFATISSWKAAHKAYLLALLPVWYADENALVRQKMFAATVDRITPHLSAIIRQGIQEGVLTTPFPDQAGEVVLSLLQSFGDTLARLLFLRGSKPDDPQHIESILAAYHDALERVLGAPPGSVQITDVETLREWVVLPEETV